MKESKTLSSQDTVEFRPPREEEREACLALWCTVWPGDHSDSYFRRYLFGDFERVPSYTQAAFVRGEIVSAVHICKRTVAYGDFRLTMGGIANVSTLPEHRGKRYNSACLQRAIAVMEADAMDFSLLFTGIPDYYRQQGYETLPRRQLEGSIRADFAPRPNPYHARPAEERDLASIRAIYCAYNSQRPFAVQRHEAYWRDWVGIAPGRIPETLLVSVDVDGRVCGYLQTSEPEPASEITPESTLRILEFGARPTSNPSEEPIFEVLLDAAVASFLARGGRRLRLETAQENAVWRATAPILEHSEKRMQTSAMIRLLHRTDLLQSLILGMNERWTACGRPVGALTFATPYGPARLEAEGLHLRVTSPEEAEGALSQETLFGLLFGSITPEQASGDRQTQKLIAALFAPHAGVYWDEDSF